MMRTLTLLAAWLIAAMGSHRCEARSVEVTSRAIWGVDHDADEITSAFNQQPGEYTLGANAVKAGESVLKASAVLLNHYGLGRETLTLFYQAPDIGPEAHAHSVMTSGTAVMLAPRPNFDNVIYPYSLEVATRVNTNGYLRFTEFVDGEFQQFFTASLRARALGADPQPIETPGVLSSTLYLDVGSSLVSDAGGLGHVHFEFTAPLLSEPLASVDIENFGGQLNATVSFAGAATLSFFDPATDSPLSPGDVESLIENTSLLGTADGLSSRLDLFQFRYDLTNAVLPPGAVLGSLATSEAAVPEPGGAALAAMGLIAFIAYRRRCMTLRRGRDA